MNWKEELAKLEFGLIRIESFPALACEELCNGLDTPNLHILAGLNSKDTSEIRLYVERVLLDLEMTKPTRDESAWIMIRFFIEQITSSQIEPHEGIHAIVWDICHKMNWEKHDRFNAGDSIGIEKLLGLCDTFDDLSVTKNQWDSEKTNDELLDELNQSIRKAAKEYRDGYLVERMDIR